VTVLAAPLIIAAHVAKLPTLPGWVASGNRPAVAVYEGAALRRDAIREWCTVGFVAGQADPALSFEAIATAQNTTREAGSIVCQLVTAADDVATARTRVFELLAPWLGWITLDRTLGGKLTAGSEIHLAVDVALATTRAGATANALVTITYTALTYG
jgi:predicted deacylase